MVAHVRVCYMVVYMIQKPAIVSIDSGQCASEPFPILALVMRKSRVSVLKKSDHHKEKVDDHQWRKVYFENSQETKGDNGGIKAISVCQIRNIGDRNVYALPAAEDRGPWIEMIDPEGAVIRSTCYIEQEVQWPAEGKIASKFAESEHWTWQIVGVKLICHA